MYLPTSSVFLTIHDKLLIARGQRAFLVSFFFFVGDGFKCCLHTVISMVSSERQRCEKFKQALTNGRSNHNPFKVAKRRLHV